MLKNEAYQFNFTSILYNKIPKNHILKRINSAISLSFVNDLLKDKYCSNFGRPAKEPEMMVRILILKELYNLSEEKVMEEINLNLACMWFIGINPDDEVPDSSLISKFKTLRLDDATLDEIINEIVRQCIEKGIIPKETGISIDATHIEANTIRKTPERIMKHLAKKIFKATGKEDYEIPNYKEIEDHNEAKKVMKEYLEETIEENKDNENAREAIQEAKEILESPLFIEQKGIRSLIDKDARVGHKSQNQDFFGYKAEFCMTTDGELITAATVGTGAYVDGSRFEKLYEQTKQSGLKIKELLGDKAYFKINIIDKLESEKVQPYIPTSASSYRIDDELYSYNKDSDQWFCKNGNETKKVSSRKRQNGYMALRYTFEREKCRNCPYREQCIGKAKTISKILEVGSNAPKYYEYNKFNQTDDFKNTYKKRARIEGKNAELKRFHGLARAKGYGLGAVSKQTKLTIIAVNLKKIAKLSSINSPNILTLFNKIISKYFFVLKIWNASQKIVTFSVVPDVLFIQFSL